MRKMFGSKRRSSLHLSWVTDDLAVSRAPNASEWNDVLAAGLRVVLDLQEEQEANRAALEAIGLLYRHMPITEYQAPTVAVLIEAADWVNQQIDTAGPVLIHCREGRGRSPMVACAALIQRGVPLLPAFRLVQRARPEVALSVEQTHLLEELARQKSPPSEPPQ